MASTYQRLYIPGAKYVDVASVGSWLSTRFVVLALFQRLIPSSCTIVPDRAWGVVNDSSNNVALPKDEVLKGKVEV